LGKSFATFGPHGASSAPRRSWPPSHRVARIGIGVNAAVFTWMQALVLNPLPRVPHSNAFLLIEPAPTPAITRLVLARVPRPRGAAAVVQQRDCVQDGAVQRGQADWAARTYGMLVSGNYFQHLVCGPRLAASCRPAKPHAGAARRRHVVRLLADRFGGSKDVLGQVIRANDRP